ncbi:carbonic anhydrase [Tricladium varicosporioides]|nr:carbonic anhydrase [Hymenoscyphus varicosporioides]
MTTLTVNELVGRNRAVATAHEPFPTFAEMAAMEVDQPFLIVLTCVDPRCKPEYFLDMKPGEGVLVMRNIAGHVTPALNDILALDAFLPISEIMVIHHTDCGASHFTNDIIRQKMKERLPTHREVDSIDFGGFKDLEQSVKDDLNILRSSPLVRKGLADKAVGYVFDIKTGALTRVDG